MTTLEYLRKFILAAQKTNNNNKQANKQNHMRRMGELDGHTRDS